MRILQNERGIALVTALLFTLISLGIVLAALYFITQQTVISAASKRYKTALEASHGGVQVFTQEILPQLFNNYSGGQLERSFTSQNIGLVMMRPNSCMSDKLNKNTAEWSNCTANSKTSDPKLLFDARFTLKGLPLQPGFNVYAKIIDTQKGNSDTSGFELLDSGAGVTGSAAGVSPKHVPAIYRIEIQGERESNPLEKAALTALYAF